MCMKKFLLIFFCLSILLISCEKDPLTSDFSKKLVLNKELNNYSERSVITNWVNSQLKNHYGKIVDSLKQNLIYDQMSTGKRNNGENILIIPISNSINKKLNLNSENLLNLVIVQNNEGGFKWSMIVSFTTKNQKANNKLRDETLYNIINNKPIIDNGLFKFLDLSGNLLYQLEFKNNKLFSYAYPTTKNEHNFARSVAPEPICIDWYLVTTYFNDDGTVYLETWEYLYTTCDEGSNPGGGYNPIDTEITLNYEYDINQTEFEDEDMQTLLLSRSTVENPNRVITTAPTPVQFKCFISVTLMSVTRSIISATASPVTVYPANETYPHPTWGIITRNITVIGATQHASFTGRTVSASWSCALNYRWSYITAGGPAKTRQNPWFYSTTVLVP